MKPLYWRLTFTALFFLSFTFSQTYSQSLTAVDPGPQVTPNSTDRVEHNQQVQNDVPSNQQEQQRDEFGQFNFNAYLTGLGASNGYMAVPNTNNENVDGSVEAGDTALLRF